VEETSLSPQIIVRDLKTRFIGQKVIYYPSLNSTMDAAKKEALWGAPAGTVVVAEEQTAGKGRLQRTWISPKGGISLSVILRPNLEYLPYMIMIASLAVCKSIIKLTGLQPRIKWPNDIQINDKKISGILIENDIRQSSLRHTIIGIGMNVNLRVADYPEIAPLATSLSDLTGKVIPRAEVIRQLLIEMENLYLSLPQKETIFEDWKNHLTTLGQNVEAHMGQQVFHGIAESVSPDGSLFLRQIDGKLIRIIAGDVTLKPNGDTQALTQDLPPESQTSQFD
jgi:BirA family transcriptional regulator, biotin operon repressor / biotin---[acetyl-CoA-carboxylase] ligase